MRSANRVSKNLPASAMESVKSEINKRKIIDLENRTVESVHQIAERLNLPVAIKCST
jgi:hypothetical protein